MLCEHLYQAIKQIRRVKKREKEKKKQQQKKEEEEKEEEMEELRNGDKVEEFPTFEDSEHDQNDNKVVHSKVDNLVLSIYNSCINPRAVTVTSTVHSLLLAILCTVGKFDFNHVLFKKIQLKLKIGDVK